jgi:branched-chain amino acid transport system substrate-binding protein
MSITPFYTGDKNKIFGSNKKKKLFIIGLVISIIVENSIIYLVEPIESKIIYTHWILLINSSTAAGLSVILVVIKLSKQKILDYHLKIHIALATGLVLWLCANIQWLIYELEEIVPDIPSLADFFWIAAYPFLGYSLYFTFKEFYKKYQNKIIIFTSLACGLLLVIFIIYITISLSVFSSPRGIVFFSVIIAYPILNIVLIIPAIAMFMGFKKEPESSIPRMFESISLINLVIADSWFVIIFLSNLVEAIWYSNLLIVDHYLIMSAGLLWSIIFLNSSHNNHGLKIKSWFNHSNKVQRITLLMSILAVLLTIIFVNSFNQKTDSYSITTTYSNINNNNHTEIKIGALLGLSGSAYESGKIQKAVLDKAVNDINENFSKSNSHNRIVLQIEDTEIKPDVALVKVKKLVDKGIRIIIGPQTSSELKKIKEYADENNVIIISQSSTAPSLSKNDTIFRLLQSDINQGKQIAEKMWNDGIKVVVPILRNDSYGNELYNITKENFEKLGGNFSNNAVKYNPHVGKFAASLHRINFIIWDQELKAVSLAVSNAKKDFSSNSDSKVGVYVIAYGELVPILIQAPSHENLDEIHWYGSEATAKNERLLKHHKAVEFAHKTHLLSPMFALDETNEKLELLENATKLELNSNDVNVYDALWIAALTENMSVNTTFVKLKENFNQMIKSYQGASGTIKLDNYGDRIGNYDFWMVKENIHANHYEWEKVTEKTSK